MHSLSELVVVIVVAAVIFTEIVDILHTAEVVFAAGWRIIGRSATGVAY